MDIKATFVERLSTKTGKPYQCIELEIAPGYKKIVFLNNAELALLLSHNQ